MEALGLGEPRRRRGVRGTSGRRRRARRGSRERRRVTKPRSCCARQLASHRIPCSSPFSPPLWGRGRRSRTRAAACCHRSGPRCRTACRTGCRIRRCCPALVAQLPADEQLAVATHVERAVLPCRTWCRRLPASPVIALLRRVHDAVPHRRAASCAAGVRAAVSGSSPVVLVLVEVRRGRLVVAPGFVTVRARGRDQSARRGSGGAGAGDRVPVAVPASPARETGSGPVRPQRSGGESAEHEHGVSSRWVTGSAGSRGRSLAGQPLGLSSEAERVHSGVVRSL
jgi:hypothetical protein